MSQLSLVHRLNFRGHFIKKIEPLLRDGNLHNSPIFVATLTNYQFPLLQPIQHPRCIWTAGDQTLSQSQCLHRIRIHRTQQPERIVLLSRQLKFRKQLLLQRLQAVIGSPQVQEGFLFR